MLQGNTGGVHAGGQHKSRYGVDERFFLYVARLEHPAKNHVRLITAFNQFKTMTGSPWQLVLVGSDWRGADVIHAILRQSPFMNDIHCLGFVPDAELPTLYRAAEVFVFPSLFEGFGMPTVEAMACGCPVLCSTQGPLGEVVGDAALALEPKDIHNMKNQLARIASDETLRDSLRTVGLEQARRFDWKKAAAATLQVYARAIQRLQPRLRTEYLESHFRR